MCLIAGGIGEDLKERIVRMILAGKHRGEDSFGVWTDEGVLKSNDFSKIYEIPNGKIALLQCRLAMTGSKGFTQPFYNEFVLVHNGEIYNHVQIREYLERQGVSFESNVDSEVILRLLEFLIHGKKMSYIKAIQKGMEMLNGDYAVAFSDGKEIYLFRDPIGIRPLYYSPNGFFASEKKVLWSIGEDAIPVNPGEVVRLSKGKVERFKVFDVLGLRDSSFPYERAKRALIKSLEYSVKIRAGEKVGVLFSGGLDSSLLAMLSSKYADVTLYTAGAEGSQDLEWARKVSEVLGLKLKEYIFDINDVEEVIPKVVFAIEEPNPMNLAIGIPLYFATKLAREDNCKLLLSGQGADELFGGYFKYLENPNLMEKDLIELGEKNLARDDKIAMINGVEGRFPFLDLNVVRTALRTPIEFKIRNGIRKAILRETALELGLPKEVAYREKKACQYGTNSQKLLQKIAKRNGMKTREFAEKVFREIFKR
ncbi:asparagine synthase (glutamine-hydrolyzing) [Thermococcus sp. M39]|uniref:asparagine synthase (glutamine-hydrolyzing) n=1 Tax=unclassified Thermococcus TaxID=2627626 RepID=UPI00143CB34E|nr:MULTISPECIES: asparagine synthase (glutamine-hydrolyzing) [unclassified Thermococcus]NJE07943.1 asparagine synthase (glutamine-hydrolyzing) [Thermococcus sp. M39]NJE13641.1 asparagine synthase (glutamine-hydrolyzing) [Thermococcus sp. LS2]